MIGITELHFDLSWQLAAKGMQGVSTCKVQFTRAWLLALSLFQYNILLTSHHQRNKAISQDTYRTLGITRKACGNIS